MATLFNGSTIAGVILLAPTTAASTVDIMVPNGVIVPIIVDGLSGTETIAVQVYTSSGSWVQYKSNSISVAFSVNDNVIGFNIPGQYRLSKPTTAAAVGIMRAVS